MKYHRNKDDKKKLMPHESIFSSKESVNSILKEYFVSENALSLCSSELKILNAYFFLNTLLVAPKITTGNWGLSGTIAITIESNMNTSKFKQSLKLIFSPKKSWVEYKLNSKPNDELKKW